MNFSGLEVELDGVFQENYSTDYDEDYQYKFDDVHVHGKATWIPVVYSLITIVGLLGNGVILVFLALKRKSWRTSDTFVLNLCVADVLLLLTLPLWAAQATRSCGWCLGVPFCRFTAAVFNINYFLGLLLLVCMSLDLYQSIIHRTRMFFLNTPCNAQIGCMAAWLLVLLLTIPDLGATVVRKDPMEEDRTLCAPGFYLPEWQRQSRLVHHIVSLVGLLVIGCFSALLWVQQNAKSLMKWRRVMIVQPLAVVFVLCWIPYSIVLLVDTSRSSESSSEESGGFQSKSLAAAAAIGCLHACLRPLLYFGLCKNFRNRALAALQCKEVDFKGSLWQLGVGEIPLVSQNVDKTELKQITTVEDQVKC